MDYTWTNADDPGVFDIQLVQNGSIATIGWPMSKTFLTKATLQFNITDTKGCTAQETFAITIIELPEFGELTSVTPTAACSGTSFEIELDEVTVDDGLDPADLEYVWGASINTQMGNPTVVTNGTERHRDPKHRRSGVPRLRGA